MVEVLVVLVLVVVVEVKVTTKLLMMVGELKTHPRRWLGRVENTSSTQPLAGSCKRNHCM